MDQTELIPEQMIFSLNPSASDKTLMNNYVIANSMDDKLRIHKGFEGPLKHLSEMILLDQYDKDAFSDADYNRIRKGISRRLLSTNKEVFPTIPDGMARIDQLREEKKDDKETLEKVENINVRFRTLGCYPLTAAIESNATTIEEIIDELTHSQKSEREGRLIDHDEIGAMEKKKQEGYF